MSAPLNNRHGRNGDYYDVLLMDYAAGGLNETLSLLVASHLTLSATARRHVALYEQLGGAMLAEACAPVAMLEGSLHAVLAQLESAREPPSVAEQILHDFGCCLPKPLHRHLQAQSCQEKKWRRAGRNVQWLDVPVACHHTRAQLVRAGGGIALPRNGQRFYTLILEGALRDRHGVYQAGELLIIESGQQPQAAPECVCLVMVDDGAKPHGWRRFWPFA